MSRKFLYQQRQKADKALDEVFSDSKKGQEVLFYLPVMQTWLFHLILALILICDCSYRGVVELLRDLFNLPISVETIHNRLQSAAEQAATVNLTKICLQFEWGCMMKSFREVNPCWWAWMRGQLTATCWRRLSTGMRTLGDCIYLMPTSKD